MKLLDDERCYPYIQWVDKANGHFKVINSKVVSRLWGIHKNNPEMTFDTLARSLRLVFFLFLNIRLKPEDSLEAFSIMYLIILSHISLIHMYRKVFVNQNSIELFRICASFIDAHWQLKEAFGINCRITEHKMHLAVFSSKYTPLEFLS